jgi:tetratricopeptide (TPR) repeat protein
MAILKPTFEKALSKYQKNDLDKAAQYCEKILAEQPNQGGVWHLYAITLHRMNKQQQALEAIDKALSLNPMLAEFHYSHAMLLLFNGDFGRGFTEYEWRRDVKDFKHIVLPKPYWDGKAMPNKTLLVLCEQGFGDNIQFARLLKPAHQLVNKIIFVCPKVLLPLMGNILGADEVVTTITPETSYDQYCELLSLPRLLGLKLDSIPNPTQNLFIETERSKHWQSRTKSKKYRVGFAWAGRRSHENDCRRSCTLNCFLPLFKIPNIQFYCLQLECDNKEQKVLQKNKIANLAQDITDFNDTAAIVNEMGLIISVDTALVHLAGTLNKPVWTLLPLVPDWRWMRDRDKSPWYASMKLFRQTTRDDWSDVFAAVAQTLRATTA